MCYPLTRCPLFSSEKKRKKRADTAYEHDTVVSRRTTDDDLLSRMIFYVKKKKYISCNVIIPSVGITQPRVVVFVKKKKKTVWWKASRAFEIQERGKLRMSTISEPYLLPTINTVVYIYTGWCAAAGRPRGKQARF